MSVQVATPMMETGRPAVQWPYAEYMARWERRQLFLRSYHFSRDADVPPPPRRSNRARRVVWAGLRRLRRAAATGLRRLRARLRICFGWAMQRRRASASSRTGFRYGRLSKPRTTAAATTSVCIW